MSQANLYAQFEQRAPSDPNAPCFILPNRDALSYGGLHEGVARVAGLVKARGVTAGDRVVAQTAKSIEAVMLYLATLKLGAIFTPLNTAYTAAELDYFIADAEPRLVVRDAVALAAEAVGVEPVNETVLAGPEDIASLIYTSGTTGRSKGAMLSHRALADNAEALTSAWGFTAGDVLLHALPIFHVHGLFVAMHCAFLSGSAMLWFDRFDDEAVIDALPRATVMMGVPTFYTRLVANPRFGREATAGMRLFISGSAPLLPSTFAEFEALTGQRILERYGMSEAVIITTNPLSGARVAGSVGYPLPGVELRVAGGETGMIEIRGPSLFTGYWRMPEKTAEEFTADGFFMTGDIGHRDPDGRVWISGRAKDLVISGGYNVYPKEIELVLDELPGVEESAVIGVPHPDLGEAVVAVITGTIEEATVIAAARDTLAGFKCPKRDILRDAMPRNAMGKVLKSELRADYAKLFA